eukprot:TRINITY_DN19393_c0_g1_i1.p1 TRINITY_DN19393_c0_g1~~TRINITY_DN19393_c0_g1_i1.p1  ORF type:complete len:156 (+),score=28.32 TRINITY_DN19393_c0_g1_i1:29-469(+)
MTDLEHKIVIVGMGGVGKSAVTIQFIQSVFIDYYDPTVEDNYRKSFTIDGETSLLDIMDTAGQEEYKSLKDQYMARGEGFLLVYSVTSRQSFDEIRNVWKPQILRAQDKDASPMVLCANKCDLENERQVTKTDGEALANSWGIPFF